MAQLKDTVVSGNLRVTDTVLAEVVETDTIKVHESSSSDEITAGENGQVLATDGNKAYWEDVYTKTQADSTFATKSQLPTIDSVPTSGSTNVVSSGGVYNALQNKVPFSISSIGNRKYVDTIDTLYINDIRMDGNKVSANGTNVEIENAAADTVVSIPLNHSGNPTIAFKDEIPIVDATPTESSTNAVSSGGVYTALQNNETVVSAAINDLDSRIDDIESGDIVYEGDRIGSATYTDSGVVVDLGDYAQKTWVENKGYLTEHQSLKTINNQSLIGSGNITISGGGGGGSDVWEPGTGTNSAILKGSLGTANDDYSVVEGYMSITGGNYTDNTISGLPTLTSEKYQHAEGLGTIASGGASHAEGHKTLASGSRSHAEGYNTKATGNGSHAEGYSTTASGQASHAEGQYTVADGNRSHAEGQYTQTNNPTEHAEGYYNYSHRGSNVYGYLGNTQHSIGIGDSESNRKNALEIMQNGDMYVYGIGSYDGIDFDLSNTLQVHVDTTPFTDSDYAFIFKDVPNYTTLTGLYIDTFEPGDQKVLEDAGVTSIEEYANNVARGTLNNTCYTLMVDSGETITYSGVTYEIWESTDPENEIYRILINPNVDTFKNLAENSVYYGDNGSYHFYSLDPDGQVYDGTFTNHFKKILFVTGE